MNCHAREVSIYRVRVTVAELGPCFASFSVPGLLGKHGSPPLQMRDTPGHLATFLKAPVLVTAGRSL